MRRTILWGAAAVLGPRGRAFRRALEDPRAAQARVRADVARDLARTAYGRSLGVTGDADDFSRRVPVRTWEELRPWVDRQRAEEGAVIAAEQVLFYEKTSGSSGPAKYVPYTAALRRTFSRMFMVWAHDVLTRGPELSSGRLYFSVSPSFSSTEATARGVPVGTNDDRDYLEGWLRPMLSPFVVMLPAGAARATEPAVFLRAVAEALLAAEDLEIISVWSPSFLLSVLETIRAEQASLPRRERIAEALARGDWTRVWPRLALVSCWDRVGAAPLAERVRALFPGVLVQGKGLLATEAPVTVPLMGAPAPVPLVDEVLIELEDEASGALLPLVDAEDGAQYRVVVSPRGGLVRYALGDRVVARGRVGATPCLDFVGRASATSDLVGEKLSEAFVLSVLAQLTIGARAAAALVPVRVPRDHYVLLVDGEAAVSAERVESLLGEAHHYRQARALGQLGPARVVVRPGASAWLTAYQARRGMVLGNIKDAALVTTPADDELTRLLGGAP